ncbi:HAMP domain-containing histidine kinase [Parabacteroides acidifaciens]|uniref:histidine kinase n=1 Tax=Parabacteroides acidifaciens TaxID=2290935 RepID=A0A3D8HH54_9BACT|nr:HAMP domain-containing sensor histidine kinase [Parabacteroides acidifaciens]MBC8601332.1 HAMP domain-containing histidine kinase [Parabacteroides acidifaciens]RDU50012.1 sensor histidine kinase [Parabacteroides acidifaciens]
MKTGNKIALFYTTITIGIIAMVTVVFYFVATNYISRLYYSYLTEKAYAIAEKHWEKDEVDEEDYARIQKHYEETLPVASEILLNADSLAETRTVLSRYLTDDKISDLYNGNVARFHKDKEFGAAVYYPDNEGNFIVVVISSNQYGGDIQQRIGWLLLAMLVVSAVLVYFVGRLYATRMVDRIDAAYQSEKSFISNASHELNNPLTAIQGECEISLLKERTPAEYQAALGRIASETKRIIQLMKNLLFLSHGDKEILKNERETVLLADFLMQFVGNRIRFTTDNFAFVIQANPYLLKIAINNILNNACKYSGEAPVEMRLKGATLTITDTGIGIPEEEITRVYQPFYRASNTREFAGHGIGLSLSMRILRTYGAEVNILSEVGKGTTVAIEFP